MKRYYTGIAAVLVILPFVAVTGCDKEEQAPVRRELAVDEPDAGETDVRTDPPEIRRAFGIPIPPDVEGVQEFDAQIIVVTRMKIDEIEEFYLSRLTDYEVIRDGLQIQIVGLRSNMAGARGGHMGSANMPVELVYYPPKPPRQQALNLKGEPVEKEHVPPPDDWFDKGLKGKPVDMRTTDGTLMAPGARWGEPYVPPEGTFFHKRTFKPNWGRPFGEWTVH